MYKAFNLSSVKLDAINKQIVLHFNFDIDEKSVEGSFLNLVSMDGDHVNFKYKVHNDNIILYLDEWPNPEKEYQILIEKKLRNIANQFLNNAIRYKLSFDTYIVSLVNIKSPYNFQTLQELTFKWEDTENIGQYYVEIAKENSFYNLVYSSEVYTNDITLTIPDMLPGQYYIRVRVQKDNQYGKWSDIVSFIYKYICDCEEDKDPGPSANASMPSPWSDIYGDGSTFEPIDKNILESIQPEVEDELEILGFPVNGETPSNFTFTFNMPLDNNYGNVTIIKREF